MVTRVKAQDVPFQSVNETPAPPKYHSSHAVNRTTRRWAGASTTGHVLASPQSSPVNVTREHTQEQLSCTSTLRTRSQTECNFTILTAADQPSVGSDATRSEFYSAQNFKRRTAGALVRHGVKATSAVNTSVCRSASIIRRERSTATEGTAGRRNDLSKVRYTCLVPHITNSVVYIGRISFKTTRGSRTDELASRLRGAHSRTADLWLASASHG